MLCYLLKAMPEYWKNVCHVLTVIFTMEHHTDMSYRRIVKPKQQDQLNKINIFMCSTEPTVTNTFSQLNVSYEFIIQNKAIEMVCRC